MSSLGTDGPGWVYRVFDSDGRLIYVGATINLPSRLEAHRNTSWWAHQAAKVKAKVYPTMTDARFVEREAICTEHPRWNVKGRWRTRALWNADDYRDYATALLYRDPGPYFNRTHFATVEREALRRYGITDLLPEEFTA